MGLETDVKFSGAYYHNGVHLHDAQIYDAREQCPICGNAQYRQPAVEIQKDPLNPDSLLPDMSWLVRLTYAQRRSARLLLQTILR